MTKIKGIIFLCLAILLISLNAVSQTVELKNNFFYIDGQKFFVKGIGHEIGATPGSLPWEHEFNPELLRFDLQRIQSAGFNTIRTWGALSDEELFVAAEFDLKIIMGIWINPETDFSDPQFVEQAKQTVNQVLSYSKNHNNIIAYLIMNEPKPETIAESGYQTTKELWEQLIQIIHQKHPGRPVSIANTSNGTYIDSNIFDFSAYNVYIYNPVTINLNGYRNYISYLSSLKSYNKPLIITEYGSSVSPSGPGNWGYGGNTVAEQTEGDLFMYKSLVDGGAAGSCIFNYSDGWWKAGDEFVHNDNAEEWFGLVEYADVNDNYGNTRAVWDEIKKYQSAIITQPRSSEIYSNKIPIEVFPNNNIKRIAIELDSEIIGEFSLQAYLLDTLIFNFNEITDVQLNFMCYDSSNTLIKSEIKSILISPGNLILPSVSINLLNDDFWQSRKVKVNYTINHDTIFDYGNDIQYIYYPHIGFNYGYSYNLNMPASDTFSFQSTQYLTNETNIFTLGAAFDIYFNNFSKRIANQIILSEINEISNDIQNVKFENNKLNIFPNPAKNKIWIKGNDLFISELNKILIYDSHGRMVKSFNNHNSYSTIEIGELNPGLYFVNTSASGIYFTGRFLKIR